MWAILLALVYAASAQDCQVAQQDGKLLKPNESVANGANFIASSNVDDAQKCHQGCCDNKECDTSFHTGTRLDSKGNNCFYFYCKGDCVIADVRDPAANFSISTTARVSRSVILPVTTAPVANKEPAKTEETNVIKVVPAADSPAPAESNEVPAAEESKPAAEESKPAANPDPAPESVVPATNTSTAAAAADPAPKPDATKPAPAEPETHNKATEVPAVKEAPAKDTAAVAPVEETKPVEHKETPAKAAPTPAKPAPTPAKPAPTPKPMVTLPNEVPAVKTPVVAKPNKEEGKISEVHDKGVVNKEQEKPETNLKVEVDIHELHHDTTYTQKDVVFWAAVVGGSCLILFGLITIVRVYRNKRRRLYASLTDDYLINGMYSI